MQEAVDADFRAVGRWCNGIQLCLQPRTTPLRASPVTLPFPWAQGAHTQPHQTDARTRSSPCSCGRGLARTSEIKKGAKKKKDKEKKIFLPNSGCVPDQRSSPARPSGPCKCKTKLKALPSPPPTPSAILLLPAGMAKELAKGICM